MKYSSSGVKQWTKQLGTSAIEEGRGVAVDSSDNIYVSRSTQGGLDGNTDSGRTASHPRRGPKNKKAIHHSD
ncbi:MAG: hypothetical protein CL923_03215 [Deltaproteobacteria bacterium]|nr:hypothetical protein [Deltaproteobacteria bacterium]